jgi:hypothetical protein
MKTNEEIENEEKSEFAKGITRFLGGRQRPMREDKLRDFGEGGRRW